MIDMYTWWTHLPVFPHALSVSFYHANEQSVKISCLYWNQIQNQFTKHLWSRSEKSNNLIPWKPQRPKSDYSNFSLTEFCERKSHFFLFHFVRNELIFRSFTGLILLIQSHNRSTQYCMFLSSTKQC